MAFFIVYQIVLTITNIHALPYDGWVEHSTPTVPLSTSHGAVGYNPTTHTIWFLGGHVVTTLDEKPSSSRQLTSYNYNTNSFTDHGNNALPSAFYGWSQNYVQFGTILYFADSVNSYVNSFDMTTESFTEDDITASQAFNNEEVCFVNIRDDYLALLGASTTVQILNMQTQKWLNNVPSLLEERRGQSCIYINDKIWSIGGYASDSSSKGNVLSIEYLAATESAISDIRNQNWRYNADSLPHAIDSSRCLGINDDILLIGGYNSELQQYLDTIYTIDSFSGFVSLSGHLAKPVTGTAAVYANDMIYAFGGWTVLTDEKTNGLLLKETGYCCWAGWQTKSITTPPSDSPTNEPSTSPSKYPSDAPSKYPSDAPSTFPSHSPSRFPSENPSHSPSETPINAPSETPINAPSETPINAPSETPTNIPSKMPINVASTSSSYTPSHPPSVLPSYMPTNAPSSATPTFATTEHDGTTSTILNKSSNEPATRSNIWLIVAVIACALVICLLIACSVMFAKQMRRKQNAEIRQTDVNVVMEYGKYDPLLVTWFVHTVQLPEFLDIFVENGYDNLMMIELIEDREQLAEMGVAKRGHQALIMSEIEKLRRLHKSKKKSDVHDRVRPSNVELGHMTVEGPAEPYYVDDKHEPYTEEGVDGGQIIQARPQTVDEDRTNGILNTDDTNTNQTNIIDNLETQHVHVTVMGGFDA
eukprot:305359_1